LDEAMAKVASESGTSFDPRVVSALQKRYQELEARAKVTRNEAPAPLSVDIKITRGGAPAAGFEAEAPKLVKTATPMHPVARARTSRGNDSHAGLRGQEALAIAALRVEGVVAYDAIAFCACEEGKVKPKFAAGDDRRHLNALSVREGEGLLGWVAETAKPILNGNPTVEPGYPGDGSLASALALPLEDGGQIIGVLALYRRERDAFGADELVALLSLCPEITSILVDMVQATVESRGTGKAGIFAVSA
jgi:hypothetical protein